MAALAFVGAMQAHAAGSGIVEKMFVQPGTGAVARTFQDKAAESISVRDFGAKGDGVTDDAPSFRAAVAYLATRGGGVLNVPAGSYFVNSYDPTAITQDEYAAFVLASGITLKGEGYGSTSLKMSTTLQSTVPTGTTQGGGRINFIGVKSGAVGAAVKDLNFDYNGIVLTDNYFRSYNAVYTAGDKTTVERIKAINAPGLNVIRSATTAGSTIVRESIITNGNKNIAGNTASSDASFIYLNGKNNLVENNVLSNDATAVSNVGGVEMHASNSRIVGNRFTNLFPAIYDGIQGGTVAKNNQIRGNYFENCKGGIQAVDLHDGWIIDGNHFVDSSLAPWWAIMTPRDDSTGATSAGTQQNVTIQNNTFETVSGDTAQPYIRMAGLQGAVIKGNHFIGNVSPVSLLVSNTENKNITVEGNIFKNPVGSAYTYGQVHLSGDNNGSWGGKFTDILVKGNRFLNDRSLSVPSNAYAIATSGSGSLTFTNVRGLDNEIVNMNAMPSWQTGKFSIAPQVNSSVYNGYEIRSTGVIEQWSEVNVAANSTLAVTFPVPFPNAALNIQVSINGGETGFFSFNSKTATGFNLQNQDNAARTFSWRAVGW